MLPRQQLSGWRPCFPPTTERNNKTLKVWAWHQIRDPSRFAENTRTHHEYSLRTDSDLGSDATPTLQAFFFYYYFPRSLEENMDATRKAVVAVALAEDQAIQYK